MNPRPSFAAAALALAALAGCSRVAPPNNPPPPPPNVVVQATGDGHSVSGYIGPDGGVFELAADGLRLTLPAGTAASEGKSLALKRESNDGVPAAAARIGDAFRSTPELSAASGKWLELRSIALRPLPGSCQNGGATLALEAPPPVGPSDGSNGPALTWQFKPARAESDRVVAELATLPPARAVFLCGAKEGSQTVVGEGTR